MEPKFLIQCLKRIDILYSHVHPMIVNSKFYFQNFAIININIQKFIIVYYYGSLLFINIGHRSQIHKRQNVDKTKSLWSRTTEVLVVNSDNDNHYRFTIRY